MRTIVDLPPEQIAALSKIGKRAKLSRAELIRRAVAEYLSSRPSEPDDAAFGLWKQNGDDGVEYQHRQRAEWDR